MEPEKKLGELGLTLPTPSSPVAAYIPARIVGNLLFISGQIPFRDGKLMATGRVPSQVSFETARECARQCVLNGLAAARAALLRPDGTGGLVRIVRVVRVGAWVACDSDYGDQPKVVNGASELLQAVFGEEGRHVRAAVGTNALPLNAPMEVEFLFEIAP